MVISSFWSLFSGVIHVEQWLLLAVMLCTLYYLIVYSCISVDICVMLL